MPDPLRVFLIDYIDHFNQRRPHRSLEQVVPMLIVIAIAISLVPRPAA